MNNADLYAYIKMKLYNSLCMKNQMLMVAIQGVSITINSITAIDLLRSLHQGTSNKRRVAGPQQSPRPSSSDPLSTEGNNIVSDESGQ